MEVRHRPAIVDGFGANRSAGAPLRIDLADTDAASEVYRQPPAERCQLSSMLPINQT